MRAEDRLLLCCARKGPGPEREAEIGELVRRDLDWERVLRMAEEHGLSALVYVNLKAAGAGVPREALGELRGRSVSSAAQGLKLTSELFRVMEAFRANGIEALPFKGPALAAQLYGDSALREFSDLDILVKRKDLEAALAVLGRLGYENREAGERVLRFETPNNERAMVREETGAVVDLHWGLMPDSFARDAIPEAVWGRMGTVDIGGKEMPALAAEDLLHFLCVHGAKHRWMSLAWVCDVAELPRAKAGIDWAAMIERARRSGTRRMVLLGLLLAHELLGANVPAEVLKSAENDAAVRRLAADARKGIFEDGWRGTGPFTGSLFLLRASERWSDRLRHVFMVLAAPSLADWWCIGLGERFFPLYYFLRPIRLVVKHAGRALSGMTGVAVAVRNYLR